MPTFVRVLVVIVLGAHVASAAEPLAKTSLDVALLDLHSNIHDLRTNDAGQIRVFVFLSTECPIANTSIVTLNELAQRKDVMVYGVLADASIPRQKATDHFKAFKATFPVLFDASQFLQKVLKPTHVPEAFVINRQQELLYRGAIDNTWEALGRRRLQPDQHYVADALSAANAGDKPKIRQTTPVGCLIEAPVDPKAKAPVTFNREIAPLVFARCTNCHREGQAAPFPLTNYAQTAKRAKQIVHVTQERLMPPWIPAPGHSKFVGERWLTDGELALFRAWADGGRVEGEAADLPPLPPFAEGWRLGKPDLIVKMPKAFPIPATGPDLLHNFVLPLDLAEDKIVTAMEFHPGNPRVAHHAVLFLDDRGHARKLDAATPEEGYANFGGPGFFPSGALGGWSVGNTPRPLPNGMGRYLKKGSDLVVQMHYHPTGRPETDQSEIGLYFNKKPVAEVLKEPAKLVGSIWMANYEIDLAAGVKDDRRQTTYTLPRDVLLVGVVPHMHLLGRTMEVTATRPDGTTSKLINITQWNYNWQDEYYYERPFKLPKGTKLTVTATFDNSASNPANPSSPPQRVTWGDGTKDEMLYCFFLLAAEKTEDLIHVILDNLKHDHQQPRKAIAK